MNRNFIIILLLSFLFSDCYSLEKSKKVSLNFIETSDVHGNLFPYNFIIRTNAKGSLARVSSFVKQQRKKFGDNCILLDNGDILQGQPTVYYYNFIDTTSVHIAARIMNYMKYDVATMGNHDVETGHKVYDRWISQCNFPVLGANIIQNKDNSPYLKPYKIFKKDGVKIAVLGMITPAIPCWLPENLWKGLYFSDMKETASRWIEIIKKNENPDLVVGLFHSGDDGSELNGIMENASNDVATDVPGFDIVFIGHDHKLTCKKIKNIEGDSVLIMDPGSTANRVASVTVDLEMKKGKVVSKSINGEIVNMNDYAIDENFMAKFKNEYDLINNFVSRKIGSISSTISAKDAYFGPCGFINLIHELQLEITDADISFVAPLSPNAKIKKGEIYVSDMFNLYKYENMLYVMNLTGKEIKDFLEFSYSKWVNKVNSENDHLFILNENVNNKYYFAYPAFNFDSAAGIDYTVDITKPVGEKVKILSMSNGQPFKEDKVYKVAINSYRGNGGGDMLTKGSGISKEDLPKRIIYSTDKDLRYYLMEYIDKTKNLIIPEMNNWKFIPEDLYMKTSAKDRKLLFAE